jgi:outer membrane protein assembly factor BamC
VRYVEPNADKAEPGFFAKLFSGPAKTNAPQKYQITVKAQGDSTTVAVLNAAGAPDTSPNAERIVKVIAEDLR